MTHFIYSLPDYLLFAFISLICLAFSMIVLLITLRLLPLEFRKSQNDFTSYICITVSTMFTILIGFCILFEFENMNKAVELERQEASQIAATYHMVNMFPRADAKNIQMRLKEYMKIVINDEWVSMAKDQPVGDAGAAILNTLFKEVSSLHENNKIPAEFIDDTLVRINTLLSDRYDRIAMMDRRIGNDVWFVILFGTFMTLLVHCLFGANRQYHIAAIIVIALVTASAVYLLVSLDRPYLGQFSVKPRTFQNILTHLN